MSSSRWNCSRTVLLVVRFVAFISVSASSRTVLDCAWTMGSAAVAITALNERRLELF